MTKQEEYNNIINELEAQNLISEDSIDILNIMLWFITDKTIERHIKYYEFLTILYEQGINLFEYCNEGTVYNSMFRYSYIKHVEISDNITVIDGYAFSNCWDLEDIKFSDSIEAIGISAFASCVRLQNIKLPNDLIKIAEFAFVNCGNLKNIKIPNKTKYIGRYAFANCVYLKTIYIPNSVKFIGDNAFTCCNENLVIYCEAAEKPHSWNDKWNADNHKVIWNYKKP